MLLRSNVLQLSNPGFLAAPLADGGFSMFARFVLTMPLSDLLFDLFGDEINGRVKVGLSIFGKKIGARDGEAHGTLELSIGGFARVVLKNDAGINGKAVKVLQLFDARDNMVLNGLGQSHVVRRQDQL